MGRQAHAAYLWLSPRTFLLGCHRSDLPAYRLSAPIRAEGGYREMFRSHLSYGAVGQNAGVPWNPSPHQSLAQSGEHGRRPAPSQHRRDPARGDAYTSYKVANILVEFSTSIP